MKKAGIVLFSFVLLFLIPSISLANKALAATFNEETSKNDIYEKITFPKIGKERTERLLNYIKSTKKPVKNLSSEDIKKLQQDPSFTSFSSQGEILKLPFTLESKNSSAISPLQSEAAATDNRVRINPTTTYPYNAIAQIDFTDGTYGYSCTGWFVDKNTVVTAAHCVYDTYNNKFYQAWYVYPAENGTQLPYGGMASTTAYVTSSWQQATPPDEESIYYKDVQYDFAVINLSSSTNHPNYLTINTNPQVNNSIFSVGYPGDKSFEYNGSYYYYMYGSSGQISKIESNTITHTAYVTSGMSGGPIMLTSNWNAVSLNSTSSWGVAFSTVSKNFILTWGAQNN
ncbi:trypsin-like serine peptidase [Thermaerobacillus caldiproteolyticus]|uniref:Serine protease n=1 Tax=Thermaerobacillus caldiproteolyticus TaxID=247480 RepID=A0A7V9Z8Q4_9BACL|nr:trypsin-like peptidase domain-containing protein [Anoxybacillus caldiproteolyticus]MBA2876097.1 V8-like Glu-specific endopeptidase [Anoxybacillus caldiproteolyticus]QPA32321.1 trypsin-like peptidase domain-containing protein [Anoxybacillus caldiproteolyticus]